MLRFSRNVFRLRRELSKLYVRGWLCMCSPQRGSLGLVSTVTFVIYDKVIGTCLPPSMHSSSQKYFRLCRSQGSPMKAPHISAIWSVSFLVSASRSFSASFSWKKSFRLRSCGMDDDSLLYLNASAMIPHRSPSISSVLDESMDFPYSSNDAEMPDFSGIE